MDLSWLVRFGKKSAEIENNHQKSLSFCELNVSKADVMLGDSTHTHVEKLKASFIWLLCTNN